MNKKLTTSEIIILVSGAIMFLFGFFAWYELDLGGFGGGSESTNAWGEGLFPLATYVPILGLLAAGQIALDKLANVSFSDDVMGFTWRQIHLVIALFAVLIMLGYLIVESGGVDKGIGFWFDLLGSIGLLVGAVMLRNEAATTPPSSSF